jgi:DNA primase
VAFGGRVMGDDEPKYLNSPETAVFHKGRELYGLYEARQATRRLDRVLVVEGYMDVVSLACHGISNVVATLGTATTGEHLRRLFRATQEVVFCFDGDRAGRDAAWRALQNCLPEMRDTRQVRFLFLPEGEDPDSLVRADGADALTGRLNQALPLSDYLFEHLKADTDTDSLDGQARLAELARPLLNRLPAGVYRELLLERLAAEVALDRQRLGRLLEDDRPADAPRRMASRHAAPQRSGLARRGIQMLLHFPGLAADTLDLEALATGGERGLPLLLELLEIGRQSPHIGTAGVLERFRERKELPHLQALLAEEMLLERDGAARELKQCLERILASRHALRLEELAAKAASNQLSADEREELRGLHRRNAAGR